MKLCIIRDQAKSSRHDQAEDQQSVDCTESLETELLAAPASYSDQELYSLCLVAIKQCILQLFGGVRGKWSLSIEPIFGFQGFISSILMSFPVSRDAPCRETY